MAAEGYVLLITRAKVGVSWKMSTPGETVSDKKALLPEYGESMNCIDIVDLKRK